MYTSGLRSQFDAIQVAGANGYMIVAAEMSVLTPQFIPRC